jgi:uncharacterized protein
MRIAIVGAGIAGLSAAWTLSRCHDVVLYEASSRLGGHADTRNILLDGIPTPVDTGFLVYNARNYPQLVCLFDHLGVTTSEARMSFAVSLGAGAYEYRGSATGIVAQPARILDPQHWHMVAEIVRFGRQARAWLRTGGKQTPIGDWLDEEGFAPAFRDRYLLPMAAAIWSASLATIIEYPAAAFLRFFDNHGLLELTRRPNWRTVIGGSQRYVASMANTMTAEIRTGSAIVAAETRSEGIWLRDCNGRVERFDQAVFASHANHTLNILGADASDLERRLLGAFRYQSNRAFLHSDTSLMPKRRSIWASWNYLAPNVGANPSNPATVTYWLNRLQNLNRREQAFVTLNPYRTPRDGTITAEISYEHPQYDGAAVAAQRRLSEIQGINRRWFCGAYCGYGFHEDGLQSGLSVAASLGVLPPWQTRPASPAALTVPRSVSVAAE